MILAILVSLIAVGVFYLKTQVRNSPTQQPVPAPTTAVNKLSPTPEATESTPLGMGTIPDDWTYQQSAVCSISFPIPPKKEPYFTTKSPSGGATSDNERYWKLSDTKDSGVFVFKNSAVANYQFVTPPQFGNGYTPGIVRVFCATNTENLTTLSLVNKVAEEEKRKGSSGQITSKRQTQKWGKTVYAVIFDGLQGSTANKDGERYFYADSKNIYFIDGISESSNFSVRDTTAKILNNLKFVE